MRKFIYLFAIFCTTLLIVPPVFADQPYMAGYLDWSAFSSEKVLIAVHFDADYTEFPANSWRARVAIYSTLKSINERSKAHEDLRLQPTQLKNFDNLINTNMRLKMIIYNNYQTTLNPKRIFFEADSVFRSSPSTST
jgi:hypothetical protein